MRKRTIPAELMKRLMIKRIGAKGDLKVRLDLILDRFRKPSSRMSSSTTKG